MHRAIYVIAIGVVAAAAAMAIRSSADRGRSAQVVGESEQRAIVAAIAERTQARVAVAVALVRGELTVPQALARFRDLLADDPVAQRGLGAKYPEASIDELATHQVALYLGRYGDENPARRDELVRQLNTLTERSTVTPAMLRVPIQ